jgi:lipid A disaccharide synthetase
MKPKSFMLIAGEASGDLLAAELVPALREQSSILHPPSSPVFFGAGGAKMAAAGQFQLVFFSSVSACVNWWLKYGC